MPSGESLRRTNIIADLKIEAIQSLKVEQKPKASRTAKTVPTNRIKSLVNINV